MATVIYAPGTKPSGVGTRALIQSLTQRGHNVVMADAGATETFRDPLATGVLREHALAGKHENIVFIGEEKGARAVRTAVEYLWKHGELHVSGVVLISPPAPLSVAPFRNILSLGKTFFEKVVLGDVSLKDEVRALADIPLVLGVCMYPTLHFYSANEEAVQKVLGRKLLGMSFTSSHPVRCGGVAILDSAERDAVIARTISWIDAVVVAHRPLGNMAVIDA